MVPCRGLCCGSGTEGVCVPGGFHHGLSCWSRCFGACLGSLLGGCLGLCPNLACAFCFATGSSVWCDGGLVRSVPPVSNVLLYLFLFILKQQQIPHKCRLVEGCLYPILFCQYLDDIQSIYSTTTPFQHYKLNTTKRGGGGGGGGAANAFSQPVTAIYV